METNLKYHFTWDGNFLLLRAISYKWTRKKMKASIEISHRALCQDELEKNSTRPTLFLLPPSKKQKSKLGNACLKSPLGKGPEMERRHKRQAPSCQLLIRPHQLSLYLATICFLEGGSNTVTVLICYKLTVTHVILFSDKEPDVQMSMDTGIFCSVRRGGRWPAQL